MALSEKERKELEELQGLESSQETNQTPQSPSALSEDEKSELDELRQLEVGEQENVEDIPAVKSAARGFVQGTTFGFADEIVGAVESAFTDKSYEESRDESRAAFERSKQANLAAFFGGELVGGMASSISTGGLGQGVRGAAVLGGLYSVGVSNKTGVELAEDAAVGAALGAGGEKVLRGIGRYAKSIFSKSSPTTQAVAESLSNSTDNIAASLETNWIKLAFSKGYNNADEVLTDPSWMRISQGHVNKAPDSINKIVKRAKDSYGAAFDNLELMNQGVADDLLGSKILDDLITESRKELVGTSDAAKWIKQFQNDLTNGNLVGDISTNATFEQLNKVKKHLSGILSRNKAAGQGIGEAAFNDRNGNRLLVKFVSSLDERLEAMDVTKTYKQINKQFSLLRTAEQVIPKGGEKANVSEISSFFTNFGSGKGATKGSIFFESLEQFDVANGTTYAQQVIQDVKPVVDNFVLANMAQFNSQFDQATSLVFRGRALASISPALAPLAAGEPVLIRLANKAGKVSAKVATTFKIPRTTQGIVDNAPIISKKLSLIEPSAAIAFNEAYRLFVETGDLAPVKALVQQAMSNPANQSQFESGIGFDGQVTSKEEMQAVRSSIMERRAPIKMKMQAITELESTGNIPQVPDLDNAPSMSRRIKNRSRDVAVDNSDRVKKAEKELGE